ncbi:MAG: hypothetical protein GX775_02395 [Erysipelothrix sp.]|nr:hypothetical protein [Erysipelothrix sp.]
MFGNFITGGNEVRMSGGTASDATLVYLANPSANFIMDGSSNFRGAIITAGFESSGDVSITYDPSIFENIPFEITSPVDNNLSSGQTQSFTMKQYPVIEQ